MAASLAGLVRQATSSITGGFAREEKASPGWEPYPEVANSSRAPKAPAAPREAPPPIPPRVQATLRAAAHPAVGHIGAAKPDPRARPAAAAAAVDPARAAVSPVQYLRELDGFSRGQAKAEIAKSLRPGMHAATFGGNPIAARAGIATLETIDREGLLENATQLGEIFRERFTALQAECPIIKEVRVAGVMIGIELTIEGAPVVKECLAKGLLINCTHGTVIRLLPAMNLSVEQAEEGIEILASVLRQVAA